jgi:hypothetical protein
MDSTWNLDGEAYTPAGIYVSGLPAAVFRGDAWYDHSAAGAFAFNLSNSPANTYLSNGARCCVRGR